MTSQSVFLAAFLGATLGWLALQIVSYTIINPVIERGRRILRERMKVHGITTDDLKANGAKIAECTCCRCGDKHAAFTDSDGKILGKD